VLPGTYDIKVSAAGFRSYSQTGLIISINTVARAGVKLEGGSTAESVTVAANAILLQTDKSDVRSEIGTVAMANLPLPGYRNYQSLINLVPGARRPPSRMPSSTRPPEL
jgi:hypothetical protein